jgi:hypothetical protein
VGELENALHPSLIKRGDGLTPQIKLPSKTLFVKKMKPYLSGMTVSHRDALLTELHQLAALKVFLEWSTDERGRASEALLFRRYRRWLATLDRKLTKTIKSMEEAAFAATNYPPVDSEGELQQLIVRKTLRAFVRAGNALGNAMTFVERAQYALSAGVHPKLRTRAEKKLIRDEPKGLKHVPLLGKKTRKIDLWFITNATSVLDKYHNKDDKPIPRHSQILASAFRVLFGDMMRTEESVRRALSPSRRKKPFQIF